MYLYVCDRQTDRQTDRPGRRASHCGPAVLLGRYTCRGRRWSVSRCPRRVSSVRLAWRQPVVTDRGYQGSVALSMWTPFPLQTHNIGSDSVSLTALCGAGAPLFSLVHLLPHLFPFLLFLSFLGFTYFLLLSIPSLSTRIVPLRFQAGGHRKRPNLGLVFLCNLCYLYSLVKMDFCVLFYLV